MLVSPSAVNLNNNGQSSHHKIVGTESVQSNLLISRDFRSESSKHGLNPVKLNNTNIINKLLKESPSAGEKQLYIDSNSEYSKVKLPEFKT